MNFEAAYSSTRPPLRHPCKRPVKFADERQRVARILLIAANALGNQLRTQVARAKNFLSAEPQAAVDIAIVGLGGARIVKLNGKEETQKWRAIRGYPLMQAEKVLRRRANAGLFPKLAFCGLNQGFIGFEMACRLVP